ncbi:MAG TPA: PqiC family protein [Nitrospirota bacterium]|nr:PqiC family protein [Nitrospirota bacterium]
MRTIRLDQRALFTLALFVVILAGCASSPSSKFYQLTPAQNKTLVTRDASPDQSLIITIGPVRIPDYLDRPQIVTRSGKNELKLSEFDRWAGSLESDINRVLIEDISSILPADRFSVMRWTPYMESQVAASYRVEVLVDRFEGTLGDSVQLKAYWGVFAQDKSLLLKKESRISEQMNGSSYDALVAAMSSALERLSSDISGGIMFVLQKEQTRK